MKSLIKALILAIVTVVSVPVLTADCSWNNMQGDPSTWNIGCAPSYRACLANMTTCPYKQ